MFLVLAPVFHSLSCGSQYSQRRLDTLRIQGLAWRCICAVLGSLHAMIKILDVFSSLSDETHNFKHSYHISARLLGCASSCSRASYSRTAICTSIQLQLCCLVLTMLSHKLTLYILWPLCRSYTRAWLLQPRLRGEIRARSSCTVISGPVWPLCVVWWPRYWSVVRI